MERDCCEFICGAPTTFQCYGIELNRIEYFSKRMYTNIHSVFQCIFCVQLDLRTVAYLGYSVNYMQCGHAQLCDMSGRHLLVTPIHNRTTGVNMVIFLQNGCMCVLKDIVDVKTTFG